MDILLIALATSCVTYTVHVSFLFEGFRALVIQFGEREGMRRWIARGIMCPYCFAHWVALVMFVLSGQPLELLTVVKYFASVWISSYFDIAHMILVKHSQVPQQRPQMMPPQMVPPQFGVMGGDQRDKKERVTNTP